MAERKQNQDSRQDKQIEPTNKQTIDFGPVEGQAGVNETVGSLFTATGDAPVQRHAAQLGNRRFQTIDRHMMAGQIGQIGGNQYLQRVMVQMKQNDSPVTPKPIRKEAPVSSRIGRPSTTRSILSNGQLRQTVRTPFTQVIARSEADDTQLEGEAEQMAPEEQTIVGEGGPPQETELSSRDSVSATATHVATVSSGGTVSAGNFGTTGASVRWGTYTITPGTGTFTVTADLVHDIWWGVLSGTGPSSQVDIENENDTDLQACNYQLAASDLTPDMSSDNGRPPRTAFWAEDLTERHELFHAVDQRELSFGPAATTAMQNWLNAQTATSAADVENTLLPQAITEGVTVYNNLIGLPSTEGDAYGDGAPLYQARADAIKTKGDAGDYGMISTEVTVLPKGGEEYEIVEGDTLWAIAERTYGHGRYWREIYQANPGKAQDGGNLIFPGTVLDLPSLTVEQEIAISLTFAGKMYLSDTVSVNGTHTFFVLPSEVFSDATNCTGDVTIDVWDAAGIGLLTTVWPLPGGLTYIDSNFEVAADIVP